MKIAFSGSHSCGKSTLVYDIYAVLKENPKLKVTVLPESARFCPLPINEQTNFLSQYWIMTNHICLERQLEPKCDLLLCDRTVLDSLAYSKRAMLNKNMTEKEYEFLEKICIEYARTFPYKKVFFLHPLNIKEDGVRSTNKKFQDEINLIMQNIFKYIFPKMIHVPYQKRDERLQFALEKIEI